VLQLDQDFEYNKKDYLERTGNVDDCNIGMIQYIYLSAHDLHANKTEPHF
jgi:hypothetical protein